MMKKNLLLLTFLSCFVLALSSFSFAEETTAENYLSDVLKEEANIDYQVGVENLKLPSIGEILFKMVFFLSVVLVIFFVTFFFLKKLMPEKLLQKKSTQGSLINVLGFQKVDAKRGLYLVEVLGKILVLSAEADGLRFVSEITDPSKVDEAKKMGSSYSGSMNPFYSILERFNYEDSGKEKTTVYTQKIPMNKVGEKINDLKKRMKF